MTARRAYLELTYENKNISNDLKPHLLSWTYTDNFSGQADDLQITLEDKAQLWLADWFPELGAKLKATIRRKNWWEEGKEETLPLGAFEIDEIETAYPPSVVTIKALSVPQSSSLRGEQKNRAWEKTKLSVIANDLAKGANLKLFFDTKVNPEYDRIEQTEETDLQFLQRLCSDSGLALKVTNSQLVIFDEYKYEQQHPVMTIDRHLFPIKSFKGKATLNDIYAGAKVVYKDPKQKERIHYNYSPPSDVTIIGKTSDSTKKKKKKRKTKTVRYRTRMKEVTYTYRIPNAPKTGRILVVRERVSSLQEAEIKCKKALREKNSQAWQMSMSIMADIRLLASMTVLLKGFGEFDGKYIITQATLSQGQSGSETSLEMRRCLEEY